MDEMKKQRIALAGSRFTELLEEQLGTGKTRPTSPGNPQRGRELLPSLSYSYGLPGHHVLSRSMYTGESQLVHFAVCPSYIRDVGNMSTAGAGDNMT